MASGFGWGGGRSRCFTYWQEIQKCYATADHPTQCQAQASDYLECLDNHKEIARFQAIQAEYKRQQAHLKAHGGHKPSSPTPSPSHSSSEGVEAGNGNSK